jgi:hypothetical protein
MLVPVVLVALAAADVVEAGEAAAAVVAAACAAFPASEIPSWMLPKPMAKLAGAELALLQYVSIMNLPVKPCESMPEAVSERMAPLEEATPYCLRMMLSLPRLYLTTQATPAGRPLG